MKTIVSNSSGLLTFILLLLLAILTPFAVKAQTQTVKGTVTDMDSNMPLYGVNVVVIDSDPFIGAVSDMDGNFRLEGVPIGRQNLGITYIGYKPQSIPNVLVTSGKEVVLQVALEESVERLNEVVITADDGDPGRARNDMAKVSARTFSPEEVTRFSGGRNDVARLATMFAGANAANDARNDIVVRGNSPVGMLWRIEGLPIGTTNHFATLGTTGGPVSALNTNVLRTSDFITGAFPAEYGNANAAVFDVKFRNGNADKHEFTAQLSVFTGMELMAEGPLNKKNRGSYLVSYRYGIASLAATGTSAIPNYQDLNFKVNFGEGKLGRFELFGMGGTSTIDFLGDEIDENDLFADPNNNAFVSNSLGIVGINHVARINNTAFVKTTIGASIMGSYYDQDNFVVDDGTRRTYRATEASDEEMRYTLSSQYNKKYNARFNMRAGVLAEVYHLRSKVRDRDRRTEIPDSNGDGVPDYFFTVRNTDDFYPLLQAYAQGEYKFTDQLSATLGLHSQYFDLTEDAMLAPRAAINWQATPKARWSVAYGLHGQIAPLPVLLLERPGEDGISVKANENLDFMKSHHFVAGYDRRLGTDWRLKAEVYYQYLFDLPVEGGLESSYSAINEGADFVFTERANLVSEGTGENYGVELTLEKFFSRGYYAMSTISVFDSRYRGSDEVERSTAFSNRYVMNALVGKEWKVGKENRNAITFDTRVTYSGGRPYTPIDLAATRLNQGRTVFREDIAFSERYSEYFRWDAKIGFRMNSRNGKISQTIFVDFQNVTNRENVFVQRYNPVTDEINNVNQIGFFPDFMYRIQF